LHSAAVLFKG